MREFVQWPPEQDSIGAAVITGSRARTDHPEAEWSDLDVLVLPHDPELFIREVR